MRPRARFFLPLMLLLAAPAFSTSLVPLSVEELTRAADVVVRARVVDAEAGWLLRAGPSRIVTFHRLEVLEVLSGALRKSEARRREIVVGVAGGAVGPLAQRVHGAPRLEPGQRVVIFLGPAGGPGGARGVVGLHQGVFVIAADGTLVPTQVEGAAEAPSLPRPATLKALRAQIQGGRR